MKIGIIGSGVVAQVLGNGFLHHGHNVMLGTGNPSKLEEWKTKSENQGLVGSFTESAKYGEIIILAVTGTKSEEAIKKSGIENLKGKTVIDATNPIDSSKHPVNGVINYFTSYNDSLMERLQKLAPEANFVKAFNSVGNAFMVNPKFPDGKPTMFICGNSDKAKAQVINILDQFGWDYEDMGKVEASRAIEPLCMLWCIPGFIRNQWSHAFKLLRM